MVGSTPEERLAQLGLELPPVPAPAAAYTPWTRVGDLVYTAGQVATVGGALQRTGKLGSELSTDEGAQQAEVCALNVLAVAAAAFGGLGNVRAVKLTVFVASAPTFTEQHLVANGASQLIGRVLGASGVHARSAVGVASLPLDSPVEVEAIFTSA